jgi:hypothetical protein
MHEQSSEPGTEVLIDGRSGQLEWRRINRDAVDVVILDRVELADGDHRVTGSRSHWHQPR